MRAVLLLLCVAWPFGVRADPAWMLGVAGSYAGLVRNEGRLECHRTVLAVQGGELVGHYWIDAEEPFEGELSGFSATGDRSGQFGWSDRYGEGVMLVVFDADGGGFSGYWGVAVADPRNVIAARRGTACAMPLTSDSGRRTPEG